MAGWFALGEADPLKGAVKGKRDGTRLTIRPTVTIENLDRFICDDEHTGVLRGDIRCPALFKGTVSAQTGVIKLFAQFGNTKRKLMVYELAFKTEGKDYFLAGQKEIEDDPWFDLWKDTTTLFTRLHQGTDANRPTIGAGILRISLPGFIKQLFSMRVMNVRSRMEKLEGFLVFGQFFLVQLWDSYFKR